MFPDAHSDPRTWHTPSPLETRRCVSAARLTLPSRAPLSRERDVRAERYRGPTDSGADPHGTRSTHPAARLVVVS